MTQSSASHKVAIKKFIERWTGHGYEKGESQTFWIELLQDVLQVEHPTTIISFENQVKLSSQCAPNNAELWCRLQQKVLLTSTASPNHEGLNNVCQMVLLLP